MPLPMPTPHPYPQTQPLPLPPALLRSAVGSRGSVALPPQTLLPLAHTLMSRTLPARGRSPAEREREREGDSLRLPPSGAPGAGGKVVASKGARRHQLS